MQVLPRSHPRKIREIGGASALFDPSKNIHTGSRILSDYLRKSGGNLRNGLLRYNGSYGTRSRYADKVLRVYNRLKKSPGASNQFEIGSGQYYSLFVDCSSIRHSGCNSKWVSIVLANRSRSASLRVR
ncbi:MAG: lytic transglycosylase domain-containing protein [Candidatus Competibacteraceae bacterium]